MLAAVRVLIVGSGGREHALAWGLGTELRPARAPGNPGIAALGECHPVRAEDTEGLLALASARGRAGRDRAGGAARRGCLRRAAPGRIPVFGPSAAAARIEGSKSFAKDVIEAAGVPTAACSPTPPRPASSRSTGSPPARASSSAARKRSSTPGSPRPRVRRAARRRGAARGRGAVGLRSVRRRARRSRSAPRATTSARRRRHRAEHRRDGDVLAGAGIRPGRGRGAPRPDPPAGVRAARPPRLAVRRRAVRRADADGRGAAGAGVQLPVRRPRDAVAAAAASRATFSQRSPPPQQATSGGTQIGAARAQGDRGRLRRRVSRANEVGSTIEGIEAAEALGAIVFHGAPRGTATAPDERRQDSRVTGVADDPCLHARSPTTAGFDCSRRPLPDATSPGLRPRMPQPARRHPLAPSPTASSCKRRWTSSNERGI